MFGRGGQMNTPYLLIAILLLASLPVGAAAESTPPRSVGKDLMTQDLTDLAGKQAVVRANEYPPGTSNPHVVSRNPSASVTAKALVFMVKDIGAPATTLVTQ